MAKQGSEDQDPLFRLFAREGGIGKRLLGQVRKDLGDVEKVYTGELKQTNHLRSLLSSLNQSKTTIPICKITLADHNF